MVQRRHVFVRPTIEIERIVQCRFSRERRDEHYRSERCQWGSFFITTLFRQFIPRERDGSTSCSRNQGRPTVTEMGLRDGGFGGWCCGLCRFGLLSRVTSSGAISASVSQGD